MRATGFVCEVHVPPIDCGHEQTSRQENRLLIRTLAAWLLENHQLKLSRAVAANPTRVERVLRGEEEPSIRLRRKIAAFFHLPLNTLLDDDAEPPPPEEIQVDLDLVSVMRNDVANDIEREKQRHYIARNWRYLGYRKRAGLSFRRARAHCP